jgi:hypothetical protein
MEVREMRLCSDHYEQMVREAQERAPGILPAKIPTEDDVRTAAIDYTEEKHQRPSSFDLLAVVYKTIIANMFDSFGANMVRLGGDDCMLCFVESHEEICHEDGCAGGRVAIDDFYASAIPQFLEHWERMLAAEQSPAEPDALDLDSVPIGDRCGDLLRWFRRKAQSLREGSGENNFLMVATNAVGLVELVDLIIMKTDPEPAEVES